MIISMVPDAEGPHFMLSSLGAAAGAVGLNIACPRSIDGVFKRADHC
jgi:hypothetical protein